MKHKVIVCGAGGFIGTHLVDNLKTKGYYVVGIDLKYPQWTKTSADEFHICDLTVPQNVYEIFSSDVSQVWQLAADMGGAEYIFTGENDANIMTNSVTINVNVLKAMVKYGIKKVFYTSSACIYPGDIQEQDCDGALAESSCYPANPDSEYGWEKLFSERLYMSYARNYNIEVRIARLHNVFGSLSEYENGKEKSPAAICRKVANAVDNTIEIFGTGEQGRSYLHIDECLEGMHRINNSDIDFPINLGSNRMITINELVGIVSAIANKNIKTVNTPGPIGVAKRYSDNTLIYQLLDWAPTDTLEHGLTQTYNWILQQIKEKNEL
jgi:GDP-D-mannose 3',5'-epimerase